ncbi:MAG TPA: prolyl oligopeptidase family serine peptidase [Mucilaginibacter sp.]|nr:prolyl oligopeptidase family serine peptidase [Mucilaginibacter sp.]
MTAAKLFVKSALILCLSIPLLSRAQQESPFDRGTYISKKDTMPYRILFPLDFDATKKYALIIVLHGAGERGNDNEAQLKYGPKLFLNDTTRIKYPAIVVYPQCPKNGWWSNTKVSQDSAGHYSFQFVEGGEPTTAMQDLLGLLSQLLEKPYVNKHRVYVGGLSMGGMGTFEILRRRPDVFAAAFAMCGGDNTLNAKIYAKKVPLWIFHGEKDNVVSPDHSIVMVNAIRAAGGNPKFTLYPNDGHNCWDDAFAEPGFMAWLFSHKK